MSFRSTGLLCWSRDLPLLTSLDLSILPTCSAHERNENSDVLPRFDWSVLGRLPLWLRTLRLRCIQPFYLDGGMCLLWSEAAVIAAVRQLPHLTCMDIADWRDYSCEEGRPRSFDVAALIREPLVHSELAEIRVHCYNWWEAAERDAWLRLPQMQRLNQITRQELRNMEFEGE